MEVLKVSSTGGVSLTRAAIYYKKGSVSKTNDSDRSRQHVRDATTSK
jgi:hypothetical protein